MRERTPHVPSRAGRVHAAALCSCLLLALTALLALATAARAAPSLTISTAPDPTEGKPLGLIVRGVTDDPPGQDIVNGWVKLASAGPCGATFDTDSGRLVGPPAGDDGAPDISGPTENADASGAFSVLPDYGDALAAGSYLACAWLDSGPQTVAAAQLPFTVRAPHSQITIIPPAHPRALRIATYTLRVTAEVVTDNRSLNFSVERPGQCSREHDIVHNRLLALGETDSAIPSPALRVGGPFDYTLKAWLPAGPYELCSWIEASQAGQADNGHIDATAQVPLRVGSGGRGGSRGRDEIRSARLSAHSVRRGRRLTFAVALRAAHRIRIQILRHVPASGSQAARYETLGSALTRKGRAGHNRISVSKVHGRRLAAGRYEAKVSAGGRAHVLKFTVRR